jgi:hypothetical protein
MPTIRYRIYLEGDQGIKGSKSSFFQFDTEKIPPAILPNMLIILGEKEKNIPWLQVDSNENVSPMQWIEEIETFVVDVVLESGHIGSDGVIATEYVEAMVANGWYYEN